MTCRKGVTRVTFLDAYARALALRDKKIEMERNEASFADLPRFQSSLNTANANAIATDIAALTASSINLGIYRPSALLLPNATSKRWADSSFDASGPPPDANHTALDTFRSLQDGAGAFKTPRLTPSVQSCRSHEESFKHPCTTPTTRVIRSQQDGYKSCPLSPQLSALRASEEGFKAGTQGSSHLDLLRQQHEDPFMHGKEPEPLKAIARGSNPPGTPPQSSKPKGVHTPLIKEASVQEVVRVEMEGFKGGLASPVVEAIRAQLQDKFRS